MGRISGMAALIFFTALPAVQADDWPQWLGPNRDGVWRENGLVKNFPPGGPKEIWRVPLGTGYSGPAVFADRVYVMDRQRATGADGKPARASRDGIPGKERVRCLNSADGKDVWKYEYDCPYRVSYPTGPRTTPLVRDGLVYTLGTMGDLCCLDTANGNLKWSKNLPKEYKTEPPVWGYAASLLLDGDLLYTLAGGEGSAVVALNIDTGKEVWRALTTKDICYSPPMIYEAGGKRQLIIWHAEAINSLDPATGKLYWSQPYPIGKGNGQPPVHIATIRQAGDLLFVTSAYYGPMMLKLANDKPAASLLWKGKSDKMEKPDGLHSLMAAPVLKGGYIYGVCANAELRCLDAQTGKQLWQTYAATGGKKADCGTAFLVPEGNRFVIFNDQGELLLADLSPQGYKEISRARILEPAESARGRHVVWSHPAFARRCVFARNEKEMVCVSLADETSS